MPMRRLFGGRGEFLGWAALTLALTVGANVLVLTIVSALWLRSSPIHQPDRVVAILGDSMNGGLGWEESARLGPAGWDTYLRPLGIFESIAGQATTTSVRGGSLEDRRPRLRWPGRPTIPETRAVTWEYFRVLGLEILGRDFSALDDRRGATPVVIVSWTFWRTVLNGRTDIIGGIVQTEPMAVQVIGVAPEGFTGARLGDRVDVWLPAAAGRQLATSAAEALLTIARLRDGIPLSAVQETLARSTIGGAPLGWSTRWVAVPISSVFGSADRGTVVRRSERMFGVLGAMAALVLIAGCGTLAGLAAAHYGRRRREFAVRAAVGCSPGRLCRGLIGEAVVVLAAGCLGAFAVASVGLGLIPLIRLPDGVDLGRIDFSFDRRVIVLAVACSAFAFAAAIAWPMWRSITRPVGVELMRSALGGREARHWHSFLIASQAAVTMVLLVGAGLLTGTVAAACRQGTGFDVDHSLFVTAWLPRVREADARPARALALQQSLERLRAVPGVEVAALGPPPLGVQQAAETETVRDGVPRRGFLRVGRAYFDAIGVPVLAGKWSDAPAVSVDNRPLALTQSLATELFGVEPPLGRPLESTGVVTAVVGDFAQGSLRLRNELGSFPLLTDDDLTESPTIEMALRVSDPNSVTQPVRRAIEETFPDAYRVDVRTGRSIVAQDVGRERLGAGLFSGFGIIALGLSLASIVALVSQTVAVRRHELGVRMALGASSSRLLRMLLAAPMKPLALGGAGGLAGSVLLSGAIADVLVRDVMAPVVFAVSALFLLAMGAVAALVPALGIRHLSPSEVLRRP